MKRMMSLLTAVLFASAMTFVAASAFAATTSSTTAASSTKATATHVAPKKVEAAHHRAQKMQKPGNQKARKS